MRLGQLARKLELRAADIVEFLSRNNIQIEEGSNTRVEDDHVKLIIGHFNPSLLTEVEGAAEPEIKEEPVIQAERVSEVELPIALVEEPKEELTISEEPIAETIEVIKAPKTELPGLKVLGKIELPEVKKKETLKPEEQSTEGDKESPRPRRDQPRWPKQSNPKREGQWKNPVALQREREERAAEEKRKEQKEKEKERRALHYMKKVKKSDQPIRSLREEADVIEEVEKKSIRPPAKTWFGKFLRWLSDAQ